MILKTNAVDELQTANELLEVFQKIEKKAESIKSQIGFYTIKDVVELTGFSEPQVQKIFNRPDFPVCDYGKSKAVFVPAFCEYFMKAVKTTDFM